MQIDTVPWPYIAPICGLDMRVTAEEVVKRYLAGLVEAGRFNKKTLAAAMRTSRWQLDQALETGALKASYITGIASMTGDKVSLVLDELAGLAKKMERDAASAGREVIPGGRDDRAVIQPKHDQAERQRGRAAPSLESRQHRKRSLPR